MNKIEFKFTAESEGFIEKEVKMKISDTVYWTSIVEEFICFLRGIGFYIPAGEYLLEEEIEELRVNVASEELHKCKGCKCGEKANIEE
jgi:hypothetical protein